MTRRTAAALAVSALGHATLLAAVVTTPRANVHALFVDLTQAAERPVAATAARLAPPGTRAAHGRRSGPAAAPPPPAVVARPPAPAPPPSVPDVARAEAPPDVRSMPAVPPDTGITVREEDRDGARIAAPAPPATGAPSREGAPRGDGGEALGAAEPGGGTPAALVGGTGASGGAAGGVSGGAAGGPEYGRYLEDLRRRVQDLLRYPATARRRGLSGTVQLELTITPDGAIERVAIVRSSSHAVLDEAAVETLRALPARPFPPELPPRPLRVRLPVVFDLR
jgi:protein TonB